MPVRSCNLSIFKWPTKDEIERALKKWASNIQKRCPALLRVGYFDSYARGSYSVGSDLDVIVVVASSSKPFFERARDFDTTELPVPVDLFIYTQEEFENLTGRFAQVLKEETIWIIP